ncbi:MAG TPA: dynamin family protein, partial [Usitatibacteraceae bacterium]|nr:dynamin family protein [Usitatibacteraceae bacterium]
MAQIAPSPAGFESEIARYNRWREDLTRAVTAYHDWLESRGQLDVQQSIRFYDLLENLNKGRLLLAFLAEFSRGKSELINALFFSSFKERLLPSDVGRTTMCPTEIFHDPNEEPYLKLLSVETRYRDESISQLKNNPVEWSKIRLNTASAADMKKALAALADTKKVYALEARMLGLTPMLDEKGELPGEEELVEVPAWRYAMINYPHPLLSNGLSILDTPGLNALGMEPELTVSTVPSAHAILFLLSIDTGVTKSDLEIWDRYVKPGLPQKIAVLNKIDLMWDELKTPEEIDRAIARMVETTGKALALDPSRVFPLSAQKALLGKIREDAGLVRKSGVEALEKYLAQEIVPMKRQILCKAVMSEIGAMMVSSRASVAHQQQANAASSAELQGLVGKSREVVMRLWQKISAEKNAYNAALAEYKVNQSTFSAKRSALMDMLNPAKLDLMLAQSAQAMEDSWTTVGLQRAMRELSRLMSADFQQVYAASEDIKKLMQGVYNTFTEKFGFQKMAIPALDLENHNMRLQLLVHETDAFSKDPVNVAHYKGPMVRKFHGSLVAQARGLFVDARGQAERWCQAVTLPLETQMKDHKAQLQARLDNLSKINEKSTGINDQLAKLKDEAAELKRQRDMIDGLLLRVSRTDALAAAQAPAAAPGAPMLPEQKIPPEL